MTEFEPQNEPIKKETENDIASREMSTYRRKKRSKKKSILREVLIDSIYLLIVFVLTLLVVKYVTQRTVVIGDSMNNTLFDGDNIMVDKISYRFSDPERFDIVVFPFELQKNTYYIKRIIGLPGETVRIDIEGNIYINGIILEENYGRETIKEPGIAINEITLGEGEYFVLGDNRNHSSDSRTTAVGIVSIDDIIGKAWIITYPFERFGKINSGN